jgi:class 3 adenylate cyclase/ribosomal protein L40E
MRCPICNSETRPGQRFCLRCGARLAALCPKCGSRNPPDAAFCGDCGTPASAAKSGISSINQAGSIGAAQSPSDAAIISPGPSPDGERRHLTVLFCDLVGSTAIASQLDPEEWRETVSEYHRTAAEEIGRFGGHVVKYLGDGVMVLFGWPEAHDNDAERAARAGLAIIDSIAKLGAGTKPERNPARPQLSARVGIDSGAVVVGAGAGQDADVFGDAPNIASRVEAAADPGTVLITAATHRLMSGMFVVEDLGARALKGIELPIELYRVIQPSGVRGRLDAAAARGLTPFVGREDELRILISRWERALEGEGQVALITGEAGIGKSRLVHRFHEQIAGTLHTWIDAAAGAFFQNSPFYPIIEMLRRALFASGDGSPDAIAQLAGALNHVGLDPAAAIPLLAPLLSLTLPAEFPPLAMPADQQRRRLLATLVEWVLGASREKPLVIATEDLHWADPSTLELIQTLVEQGAMSSLLLLYTARPEFKAPWAMRAHHTQITLNRLGTRDVREMIARVSARIALAEETVTAVVTRTGGVPLFVEELTRAVLERGGDSANREIPATLHDSLMARLDRLGSAAKEVAQVAAVIGREFSYALLHAIPCGRGGFAIRIGEAGGSRADLYSRDCAGRDLHLQACVDPGCSVRGTAKDASARITPQGRSDSH